MPTIDMPLSKLKEYRGSNPSPPDFDEYWKRALDDLGRCPPKPRYERAAFFSPIADAYHLRFSGIGDAEIYAKCLIPKRGYETGAALLKFHGYTMNSGDWFSLLPYAASGIAVFALDCRGQGGKSWDTGGVIGNTHKGHIIRGIDDSPDKLLYRAIFLDTVQLARIAFAHEQIDATRIGTIGASQGGALALACAALEPRIVATAPVFPFLCDYLRVWQMDMTLTHAYSEITEYFRRFDPTHEKEEEFFQKLGYIDICNLMPRIKAQVLFFTGLMDETCPPSSQFAAYNRIKSEKKMVIYPDFAHEELPRSADKIYKFMIEALKPLPDGLSKDPTAPKKDNP